MSALVLYHAECNDGLAAAWAVREYFVDINAGQTEVEYVAVKHGSPPPDVTGKDVILLDFVYKRPVLLEMLEKCRSMEIYDHHQSAAQDLQGLVHKNLSNVVFDMNRSGAGISWDVFHEGEPRPQFLNLIEDNDLWRFKYPETKAFVECVRSMPRTFETLDTLMAASDNPMFFDMLLSIGKGIVWYKKEMVNLVCQFAQEVEIGGHKVWCVNVPYVLSSETGHALIRDRAFGATYYWDGESKVYRFSLRSQDDREDVAKVAQMYGGGGHRNASGFQVTKLPWT